MPITPPSRLACTLAGLAVTASLADAAPRVRLGRPKVTRGTTYITDEALLATVAPQPDAVGVGGIEADLLRVASCADDPRGAPPAQPGEKVALGAGLVLEVTAVEPGGRSRRGWPGNRCGFKIYDRDRPALYAELPLAGVPRFTAPSAALRAGDRVYVNLSFNGSAREIDAANFVVALDLEAHQELWRTPKFTSNAALLLVDDALITGYGFTRERASLYVIDTATGKIAQRRALPKAPSQIVRQGDRLFVRIYDGYAELPIVRAAR